MSVHGQIAEVLSLLCANLSNVSFSASVYKLVFIRYSVFSQMKACILSVHPTSKVVHLTLRQAFLHPGGSPNQLSRDRMGAVVEESTVKAFYKQFGAIFELDDGTLAFARVSTRMVRQVLHSYLSLQEKEARRSYFLPLSYTFMLFVRQICQK